MFMCRICCVAVNPVSRKTPTYISVKYITYDSSLMSQFIHNDQESSGWFLGQECSIFILLSYFLNKCCVWVSIGCLKIEVS